MVILKLYIQKSLNLIILNFKDNTNNINLNEGTIYYKNNPLYSL